MPYLDNAATSYPKPKCVIDKMVDFMTTCGASPGRGGYKSAFAASEMLFACQEDVAKLFSIPSPEQIIFTKNSTEAINCAMFGIIEKDDEIIISSMEHNSVLRTAHECVRRGAKLKIVNAEPNGKVSPESIEKLISPKTKLICIIHSSNVTGTINDIYEISRIGKKHNVYTLFDCAQSAGVIPINASDFDMFTFSGHKGLFAPMGTGGLYVREGINLKPLLYGGTGSYSESAQMPSFFPDRFHAGTLNAPGIAALSEGVRFILREGVYEKEREITAYLYSALSEIKNVVIPGEKERTSAVSIVVPNHDSVAIAQKLDKEYSIAVRAGLHCAPLAHRTIGTFHTGTIRFSPGFFTEKSDIDYTASALKKILSN